VCVVFLTALVRSAFSVASRALASSVSERPRRLQRVVLRCVVLVAITVDRRYALDHEISNPPEKAVTTG
jgi:hypothetical protein